MKLDKIDLRILSVLQRDGRITKLGLAEAVHLSPAACWERLRRLETAGVIRGYSAMIDMEKIARRVTVLVEITLKSHRQTDFQLFEAAVAREPSIVSCHATGGGIDYMLKVIAPDIDAYQKTIDRLLTSEVGIDRYFTYVVTKIVKDGPEPADLAETSA
ncbi:MAG: Lrp/AsnC family transcriptional regulator [Pseudolabrys sp.]|nr:Lrp/AsnC family transcriptional regulator [Pseudolabrys sp.]